jgi:hypothetical protein
MRSSSPRWRRAVASQLREGRDLQSPQVRILHGAAPGVAVRISIGLANNEATCGVELVAG